MRKGCKTPTNREETMKRAYFISVLVFASLVWALETHSAQDPKPFGFQAGKTTYEEGLNILQARKWKFREYDKKHSFVIEAENPQRGKNTLVRINPEGLEGAKALLLFFNSESILDAIMLHLEPRMFEEVMDELDSKYELVKKNLVEKSAYSPYPYVLWQGGNAYVELQKLSRFRVRLIYVDKLLYENYRDFLHKEHESFWPIPSKQAWIKDL